MSDRLTTRTSPGLQGTCIAPGDKSISHRAVILGAIADGKSKISNFLLGADCLATVKAMGSLGVQIDLVSNDVTIAGVGLHGLSEPNGPVDCDNSGTTMRLLGGLLSGQTFDTTLTGTPQLSSRPMLRITKPLANMGAQIESTSGKAPLLIRGKNSTGSNLWGKRHKMTVASAQVKSCILLAGLYADDVTEIVEKGPSRDHTERMLKSMGADITFNGNRVSINPSAKNLEPLELAVPGDMSSAAFLLVAATIIPGSNITIQNVGMNPTRSGIVDALIRMGADIDISNKTLLAGEPVADLNVRSSNLHGENFEGDEIVTMIDELQVLAVAATQATGTTTIRGARELRIKETDRIATTASELRILGANITELDDGMVIEGRTQLDGAVVSSHGDHRAAMLLAVAGLVANGETTIKNSSVTWDSFPGFEACLSSLGAPIEEVKK